VKRPPYPSRRSPVYARNVVATSQPLATQAGLTMLACGGNAVDAAIAAAMTLAVVEPTGNGVGADAFCILWDGARLHGFNASGRSPAAWSPQRFAGRAHMPARGWESVTVPGAVSAWVEVSERFGRLSFAELAEPAIRYAEEGFLVSPVIATLWRAAAGELHDQPGFAETFLHSGCAPVAGERFRNPDLARSLRAIARSGGRAFYEGELAQRIADHARAHGAALSMEDLAAHRNEWCGTVRMDFGAAELHEIPPNGQGIAACMALGILAELGIGNHDPDGADALHLQIEAMKLAFADLETWVGDPGHMQAVSASDLLDRDYLRRRARLVDPRQAQDFGAGPPRHGGTVCLAAGDASGMMVSWIQSNYQGFGSGVVVPGTGIALQNRGHGFSLERGHPNEVGPSKRPLHTIIPGFVLRGGAPEMAFGLMGGPMQAQGHVQMALRTFAWAQDPQTAADAPRWRVVQGREVAIEPGFATAVLDSLEQRGHRIEVSSPDAVFGFGGAQLVRRLPEGYVAGSDPRKDGHAGGF
jgi:gamma-glutamyltranspeptidase / glutathione hydrolase